MVLLATHNGMPWLEEQLNSILSQRDVNVELHISDDASSDDTIDYLTNLAQKDIRIKLLSPRKLGSAGKNFFRLINEVDLQDKCDYVAFSDQDDIWEPNKLIRHIDLAKKNKADGVSSDVTAFWESGPKRLIVKSQPQLKWDYLFESAGPGCTFLMTPWLLNKVREQLMNPQSYAPQVVLHDWLTYAVCRAHGRKWIIDPQPSMLYRQHSNNVVGANIGLKAKFARFKKLRQGWYRAEVIKVVQVAILISGSNEIKKIGKLLSQRSLFNQIRLLEYVPQVRRSFLDRLMLFVLIASFLF